MTRNLADDNEDLTSRDAPPARRIWRWAFGFAVTVVVLAIVIAAFAFPRPRDAAVTALLSFWHRETPVVAPARPPMVRTALVVAASGREARFTGVVHARYESGLGFRVAGKIIERLVDAGERVRKGQPLMRLDPTDLALALRAAHSEAEAARAMATQTQAEEARQRALVEKLQASRQAYERSRGAGDSAAAKLVAALAQERQVENQATYAVLLADADGVVMETSGEPGQVVAVGQSVVRLAHDGAREAEVYIPEGERVVATGSAALYGASKTWFLAKLREISASADPQTRTFRARYRLEGAGRNAALGATVTIRVPKAATEGVAVPAGALFDDGGGAKVWVVDRVSSTVAARSIRVLDVGDEEAAVAGDLHIGERVVALGVHLLQAGEAVGLARAPIDTSAR